MKSKRNILVGALLSIMLCVSVIAGATFALFTGKAETDIAVKAGEIKLTATVTPDEANTKVFAGTVNFNNETNTLELNNIVPMDKVAFTIAVKNDSNVRVKYRTVITGKQDDGLLAGLKLTLNGTEYNGTAVTAWNTLEVGTDVADVNVVVELPRTAGDEYQGKSCVLNYKVEAVQGNVDPAEGLSLTGGNTYLNSDVAVTEVNTEYTLTAIKTRGDTTTVNIVGGNYNGGSGSYSNVGVWADLGSTVNISGGSFDVGPDADGGNNSTIYVTDGAKVEITGGFFKNSSPAGHILNVRNDQSIEQIQVKGGTFVNQNPADGDDHLGGTFVADGYHVEAQTQSNGDVWFIVKKNADITPVADTADIVGEVTIKDEVIQTSEEGYNVAAIRAVGADANVTVDGGYYVGGGKGNVGVYAKDGATVHIKDAYVNGGETGNNVGILLEGASKVVIDNGYFTVGKDANSSGNPVIYIYDNDCELEINGGFFETDYADNRGWYFVINIKNEVVSYKVTVKGGTFVNYDPSKGDDNLKGNFVAEGYKVVTKTVGNDTWYTVVKA